MVAHLHLFRVNAHRLAVFDKPRFIGPQIHQAGNGAAGLIHSVALKQLADLIKQHDGHGLRVFADGDRADGGQGHQEVLVKYLPAHDALYGAQQHIIADQRVGGHHQRDSGRYRYRQDQAEHEQQG
ncbi:hypothetical protein SDC9_186111 [bioreactor metagenome]|uniref:Uncharacterized protein n=1 Tax=bioreactor metagenome TaxID=1076179 RepID=A0A645HHZ3_9ZZZZ